MNTAAAHQPSPFLCPRFGATRREVALEEFAEFTNVKDAVFVRIANIPLQESIRDLRCGPGDACCGLLGAVRDWLVFEPAL